ncbi:MAG TPA: cysteine desulfurase [Flavobacteriales bacterium]|nr:cysteine desulfurase [Flavobacteriales bacterium]
MHVYLDNAATTPVAPEVAQAMMEVYQTVHGNPSSTHAAGRKAKALVETSRRAIAKHLNCPARAICFTSGGTEADNHAIQASVRCLGVTRIVTSAAEHSAVIKASEMAGAGFNVEVVHVKHHESGEVDLADLEAILGSSAKKTLVSLMHANNEVGVMLDLQAVSRLCRQHDALLHSDTVQTMGHYPMDLSGLDVDFLTCSAHKFHGPKGSGFLYVNPALKVEGMIVGGGQERLLRGGTENVAGIVGLRAAMDLAFTHMASHESHVRGLKRLMVEGLKKELPGVSFNGDSDKEDRLYTVLNVKFPPHPNSGMAVFLMDLEGIACSGGSACSSGATMGSHVLRALGFHEADKASVRFSFSRYTTEGDIQLALAAASKVFAPVEAEA